MHCDDTSSVELTSAELGSLKYFSRMSPCTSVILSGIPFLKPLLLTLQWVNLIGIYPPCALVSQGF